MARRSARAYHRSSNAHDYARRPMRASWPATSAFALALGRRALGLVYWRIGKHGRVRIASLGLLAPISSFLQCARAHTGGSDGGFSLIGQLSRRKFWCGQGCARAADAGAAIAYACAVARYSDDGGHARFEALRHLVPSHDCCWGPLSVNVPITACNGGDSGGGTWPNNGDDERALVVAGGRGHSLGVWWRSRVTGTTPGADGRIVPSGLGRRVPDAVIWARDAPNSAFGGGAARATEVLIRLL
jgi:hypothetical protein